MTSTRTLAFTTAHGVVHRVHCHTANAGTPAEPAGAPGFTQFGRFVLTVADLTDTGPAQVVEFPYFAGWQPDQHVGTFLGHQLSRGTGAAHQLSPFADLHLDIVDYGTQRDVCHGQTVTGLNIDILAGYDLISHGDSVGRQDVFLLAVEIAEQGNISGPVRVVFDRHYLGGDINLIALEIDYPVLALVPPAAVA